MIRIGELGSCVLEFLRTRLAWPIYGWFVFFLPVLLAIAISCLPNMLEGFLILRTESLEFFFWDMLCLSTASLIVSAMGGAIVRLFDLYSRLRYKVVNELAAVHRIDEARKTDWFWWSTDSAGWPIAMKLVWLAVAGYLPYRAFQATTNSLALTDLLAKDKLFGTSWLGTFSVPFAIGIACSVLWLFLVSLVHLGWARFRGTDTATCGLLPFEDLAAWILDTLFGKPQPGVRRPISWLWVSPGFTEPNSRKILPGHLQVLIMFALASIFYCYLFVSSYGGNKWPEQWYPVGIYAMLILFLLGSGLGWFVFLLGRHRVSIWIVALIGLLLIYTVGQRVGFDTNRYFVLSPHRSDNLMVPTKGKNEVLPTFLHCLEDQDNTDPDYAGRRKLFEIYSREPKWVFPKGPDGKATMIVVTASGGGIQASAWTAQVLVGLDQKLPQFSESIGLVSGVSGGSVGVMYYLGHRPFRFNDGQHAIQLTDVQRDRIVQVASDSCLESVGWGMAFPDLGRSLFPFPVWDREIDRGWALESRWWNRMGRDKHDAAIMKELRIRDLVRPANQGHVPPTIFNATAVETGQRVMIANFLTNEEVVPATLALSQVKAPDQPDHPTSVTVSRHRNAVTYDLPTTPIDLLDFYEPLHVDHNDVNPRISTSVRLSASFAYVTPVARPLVKHDRLKPKVLEQAIGKRLNINLCDGGYSDNTGLVATIHLIAEMLEEFREQKVNPPFDRILFVNIESFPENAVIVDDDSTGIRSGFFGPANALANARVSSQAERALLELSLLKQSYARGFGRADDRRILSVFEANQETFKDYEVAVKEMRDSATTVLHTIEQSGKRDDVSEIANGLESITPHESILDEKFPDATWGKINKTKNFADQIQSVAAEWKEQIGATISQESKSLMDSLDQKSKRVSELATQLPAKPAEDFALNIEIGSIQMRFNPGQDCSTGADSLPSKNKIETPPLSWLLSPLDKHRLANAWKAKACLFRSSQQLADDKIGSGPVAASAGSLSTPTAATTSNTGLSKYQSVEIAPEKLGDFFQVNK